MVFVLCGFGGYFVAQMVKTIWPVVLNAKVKALFALLGSIGISAAIFPHRVTDLVVYGVAGAGFSILVHRVARLASAAGDWYIRQIIRERGR